MKKNKIIIMLLLLTTITMMHGKEPAGILHTITTKTPSILEISISIRIRSEGTKRIVSVPVNTKETVEVGYKATDGKFYKKDGTEWKVLEQYYHYVDTQNTYIESENGIIELEEVGYYEGEVITKERTTKTGSYEDVELSSKAEINIIVISEKGAIKKILSFKDKYAIGNVTQKELNDWIEWLKSSNKTENELFSKLSQRVYITLKSENPYQGLYEEGGEYLRKYFNISYENKKFDSEKASALESKGKEIVEQNVSYSKNPIKNFFGMGNNNRGIIKEILGIENNYDSLLKIGEIVPDLKEVKAGDIVAFKENGNPETGIVINVTDKEEIAYINADVGYAKSYTLEEIKNRADGGAFTVIRILDEENQDIENASWNVLEDEIKDVKISVETMKESSQKSNEKHRWIPNTGEYLELSNIRITIKTTMGIELVKNNCLISLVGAVDRGYVESPSSGNFGNIYKNKATKFDLQCKSHTISEFSLEKKQEGEIYSLYEANTTNEEKIGISFLTDEQGFLIDTYRQKVSIKIRPDVKQIYPGDDLLLLFMVGNKIVTVDPEDYIAVYDKKMLWRANLYINEIEQNLGNLDWNEAHKWNIPSQKEEAEDVSSWWSSSWGYNEWNKQYDLGKDSKIQSLKDLQSGNGGQVVNFTEWTPLRKESGNITDRVAYDYPFKQEGNKSEIYAWDSPFDFVYKLNQQKKAISSNFLQELEKIENEEERVKREKDPAIFYNEDKTIIDGNKETIGALSTWQTTAAPNNKWRYYWREGENGFVPGLGLFIYKPTNGNNDVKDENLSMINRKSAGTDCIGFAERTASYENNKYKWSDLLPGIMEKNDNKEVTRVSYYPEKEEACYIILTKEQIGKINGVDRDSLFFTNNIDEDGAPTEKQLTAIKEKFLTVIPGDIITYKESGEYCHIGIVTNINYKGIMEAQSIVSIMDNIQVVESYYGSYVNYVYKRMATEGFKSSFGDDTYITGSWFYGWINKAPPEIRDFQIERLIIKENTNK